MLKKTNTEMLGIAVVSMPAGQKLIIKGIRETPGVMEIFYIWVALCMDDTGICICQNLAKIKLIL